MRLIRMKRKRFIAITAAALFVIMLFVNYLGNAEAVVNTSQVVESYGGDHGTYKAAVTFDMVRMKKASRVQVMVIYPNDTVEFHDVSSTDGHYRLNITKSVEEFTMNNSNTKSPEFMITWISGHKKRIKYVYSGIR